MTRDNGPRLAAMSLLFFLLMAGTFNSLGLVLPAMVADLGMSWTQAGAGFTLLGVSCGAVSLVPALLIRRTGVGVTLAAGTALLVAGFVLLAAAHGPAAYWIGTILLGLGFCFCGPVPGVHVISSSFARQATPLGAYFTIGGLGSVIGPLFYLAAQQGGFGWRQYWLAFAIGTLVLGLFAMATARGMTDAGDAPAPPVTGADSHAAATDSWTVRAALRRPQFWLIVLAYTACLVVNTTTHSFSFQQLLEHGMAVAVATKLISLSALISAGGAMVAGVVGARISPRGLTLISLACLGAASIALAIAVGVPVIALWVVATGAGLGFCNVGTTMLLQAYFGRRASLELYSIMTVVSTSAALGPALGGIVRDATGSFAGVFYVLAAIDLVIFAAVALMRPPRAASITGHAPIAGIAELGVPLAVAER